MKLWKILVLATLFVLWVTPAIAAGPDPAEADTSAVLESGVGEAVGGSCSGCSGWVWARPSEAWRYVSGSEERIWCYFVGGVPAYAYADTGDARHLMFLKGAASYHYIGTYWHSSSSFSNVRLYYY
jgi:hypothetical protein